MSFWERIPFVSRIMCDTVDLDWAQRIGEKRKSIDEIICQEGPKESEGKPWSDSRVSLGRRASALTNLMEREKSERT
jgi:hypothetical protein